MASNDPTPQLYARVPVRWEKESSKPTTYRLILADRLIVGRIQGKNKRWAAHVDDRWFAGYWTSPDAARKAVEEYWAVAP